MAELYLNKNPHENANHLTPKKETIAFLLSYSKALHVATHESIAFETIIN
ncbi:MAG: hypothetical protein ACTJGD_03580 [Mesonia hippocampi]|uniref:Uncharacterized protein n=1 Tax=Mesonia hippocampi TaxID=1628250 RepID=A0A840ENC0_9FLAO|nr:hypothetical protein [Mesonia hippocampi]MBB4119618.1 hypothetical protein [Mesonia hippocampi]